MTFSPKYNSFEEWLSNFKGSESYRNRSTRLHSKYPEIAPETVIFMYYSYYIVAIKRRVWYMRTTGHTNLQRKDENGKQ